jgi:diketogulonate reductase-like aldo/keto reductase
LNELEEYIQRLEAEGGKGAGGEISVGQWEIHPWLGRKDIVDWCQSRGVVVEAYCPLVRGQRFGEEAVSLLAERKGKTAAQILIRWSLQKVWRHIIWVTASSGLTLLQGFVPLPKSVTPSRIEENAQVYDFELTEDEMELLSTDEYAPCSWDPTVSRD